MATIKYRLIDHGAGVKSYEFTLNGSKSEWSKSGDGGVCRKFINTVKQLIPASHRVFDPTTFQWEVDFMYWLAVQMTAKTLNISMVDEDKSQVKDSTGQTKSYQEYAENFFYEESAPIISGPTKESVSIQLGNILGITITTQPLDELKKLYRRKALELHPDRNGGDASKMSELNSLWSVFSR